MDNKRQNLKSEVMLKTCIFVLFRGTRVNQDYQREVEDFALNEIAAYLGICQIIMDIIFPHLDNISTIQSIFNTNPQKLFFCSILP